MSVRADAATEDLNKKLKEVTETVSEKWEETDDKPAVITLGVYGLIGLTAANGVLKSIDSLPLIPDLLELVGIGFSGFYIYQNLLFKPDRAALKDSISKSIDKILKRDGEAGRSLYEKTHTHTTEEKTKRKQHDTVVAALSQRDVRGRVERQGNRGGERREGEFRVVISVVRARTSSTRLDARDGRD